MLELHPFEANRARNWYELSRESVKAIYGDDWRLFCGLLAATSARASVKGNVTLARKAYNQIKDTGTITRVGFINSHHKSILRVIKTGEPAGRKCKALYQNMIGNEYYVPVDIWMMRYAGINKQAPSRLEYDIIEERVRDEAKGLGITTAQRQAEIWSETRGSSESYAESISQYRMF